MAKGKEIEGLTPGRIVHYVLDEDEHRPAIIVRVWDKVQGTSNLQVFVDGENDAKYLPGLKIGMTFHATSVLHSDKGEKGTWHFVEPA